MGLLLPAAVSPLAETVVSSIITDHTGLILLLWNLDRAGVAVVATVGPSTHRTQVGITRLDKKRPIS